MTCLLAGLAGSKIVLFSRTGTYFCPWGTGYGQKKREGAFFSLLSYPTIILLDYPFFGKVALGVEGGHTAGTRRGDRLAVHFVLGITTGEHPFDPGVAATGNGADVARLVEFQPALENIGVRLMADSGKKSVDISVINELVEKLKTSTDGLARAVSTETELAERTAIEQAKGQ